jgi:enterochelin esterase-like enzyme
MFRAALTPFLIFAVFPVMLPSLMYAEPPAVPAIHSPEVLPDGRVTFRFYDPGAKLVELTLEGSPHNIPMQRDEQGVWSFTSNALEPDYYGYAFIADGVRLLDPNNAQINPNLISPSSVVHVVGPEPQLWDMQDVPHGVVHHHFFRSAVIGDERDFYVYTPPGYDAKGKTRYPVLYLLHGFSDDASAWTAVGKANAILDNLIAQGKVRPMILVMPLDYGEPALLAAAFRSRHTAELWESNVSKFQQSLLSEVMPRVESAYRISKNRDDRAITGLSMGGAESLDVGLHNLDQFAWIGGFSSAMEHFNFPADFSGLDAKKNKEIRLLWIACGVDDHLIGDNRSFIDFLKSNGLQPVAIETPGAHTWLVWRRNLIAFAPQLFRKP